MNCCFCCVSPSLPVLCLSQSAQGVIDSHCCFIDLKNIISRRAKATLFLVDK